MRKEKFAGEDRWLRSAPIREASRSTERATAVVLITIALITPFPTLMADHPSAPPSNHAPQEFSSFIRSVKAAKYSRYAGRPGTGTQAAGEAEFNKMKQYLLEYYRGVKVEHSFVEGDSGVFDCVLTGTQPSLQNPAEAASPPPELPSPKPGGTQNNSGTSDRSERKTSCPANTIPLRRITLDELLRFGTLQRFLQKSPGEHLPGR